MSQSIGRVILFLIVSQPPPWMSWDNYEDFPDKFKVKNYEHFSKNPGLYFDNEISDYEPIMASWGSGVNILEK